MDKNTITGLMLMALVIFGFMWLNKPSQEELEAQRKAQQELQEQQDQAQAKKQAARLMTPEEKAKVAPTVQTYGEAVPDKPGAYRLKNKTLDLVYNAADSTVTGVVRVGGKDVDAAAIIDNKLQGMAPEQVEAANTTLRDAIIEINRYKSFAKFLDGDDKTVVVENDNVRVTFGSRGARIAKIELKKYLNENTEPPRDVVLFEGDNNTFDMELITMNQRINTSQLNFDIKQESDSTVLMTLPLATGVDWKVRYTVVPEIYVVKMDVEQNGMSAVIPASTNNMKITWHQKMVRNEVGRTFEERYSTVAYKFADENPDELSASSDDSEDLKGNVQWVAFKNQFFSSVVIPGKSFTMAQVTSNPIKNSNFVKDMSMEASLPYSAADGNVVSFDFYLGPNDYPLLSSLDDYIHTDGGDLDLNTLVPLGWWLFRWINKLIIIPVFTFLGHYISNYGIIILLLTIFIKIILFPFTYKSYVSQAKMKVLAPEIKEINDKYPGQENAMKRQQETMALYSKAGASPFSGCLPMLLQMPVLIAMFAFFPSAIELRGQSFLWAHDLSAPDSILTLPFKIPFYGDHVSLFCLLMTVTNIIYTRISMASNPSNSSMPGMKWMMYLMPVMFLFFFNDYASGLSYYYFLSLLITIVQTYVIRHFFVKEEKVRAQMLENAKKPKKKSGFMARLEKAQKQQEAYMRQQAKQQAKKRK